MKRQPIIILTSMKRSNGFFFSSLWEEVNLFVSETMVNELTEDITHPLGDIRLASSLALATALGEKSDLSGQVVTTLLEIYEDKMKVIFFVFIGTCQSKYVRDLLPDYGILSPLSSLILIVRYHIQGCIYTRYIKLGLRT